MLRACQRRIVRTAPLSGQSSLVWGELLVLVGCRDHRSRIHRELKVLSRYFSRGGCCGPHHWLPLARSNFPDAVRRPGRVDLFHLFRVSASLVSLYGPPPGPPRALSATDHGQGRTCDVRVPWGTGCVRAVCHIVFVLLLSVFE